MNHCITVPEGSICCTGQPLEKEAVLVRVYAPHQHPVEYVFESAVAFFIKVTGFIPKSVSKVWAGVKNLDSTNGAYYAPFLFYGGR